MTHLQSVPIEVLPAFQNIAPAARKTLLDVRAMIFDVARTDPRIGEIEEALRWGEPAYITSKSKTGSTVRLSIEKASGKPALFFNCKTTLVETFRDQFGGTLRYSKNRAVILDGDMAAMRPALQICIAAALTYHLG